MSAEISAPIPGLPIAQRYGLTLAVLLLIAAGHLSLSTPLALGQQARALLSAGPQDFAALQFTLSVLPRWVMAVLVGAALGLSGSVLQQMTQNRLVSPMTLGVSSGAWLGLLSLTSLAPSLAAGYGEWAALGGALLAVAMVLLIGGREGIAGLPVVLAGMALNLLLGALAAAILLIDHQQTRSLLMWGAGDLGQIDWQWVDWLLPRMAPCLLLFWLAPRPLSLLRLGSAGAQARGLSLWPVMLTLFLGSVWLTSIAVTAVGLIGFIGLLAPNLAQLLGARGSRDELVYSSLLGVLLLLGSDALALALNRWVFDLIPSGATVALLGAPAMLWLFRRQSSRNDQRVLSLPTGALVMSRRAWAILWGAAALMLLVSLCVSRNLEGWQLQWPSALIWSLRWPRVLAAAMAGCGLAVAGMLLQRLLRNPLASPDVLGLTAGAALSVTVTVSLFGSSLFWLKAPLAAFIGSLLVLGLLLLLGRRQQYSPGVMVLIGIALSALLSSGLQFGLAKGSSDSLALLGWLAGSTYRVTAAQASWLSIAVLLLLGISLALHRALTLISIGDGMAQGRGLNVMAARMTLLIIAALLCALVTCLIGPVAFVGLLAPHMAVLLGARKVLAQAWVAALLGSVLLLAADWLGRTLIFPLQVPVGIVASVVCGVYFVYLLIRQRCV